jgi:hypothetical protein
MNNEIGGDPTTWALSTWILAIVMAISGGMINLLNMIKTGEHQRVSFMAFIGEFFSAGFVGVGVFMALLSFNYPMGLAAFSACVCGHFSTRLLFKIESLVEYKLDKWAGVHRDENNVIHETPEE